VLFRSVEEKDIPDDYKDMAELWRHDLIERVAELDDTLAEKFLEDQEITPDEIRAALRKGTIALKIHPTFCGAALQNIGVQRLIDGVIDYLPNPTEVPDVQGTDIKDATKKISRPHSEDAPFSGLVFKIVNDAHGDLTYIRVYSGVLEKGTRVLNSNNGRREIVSRIFEMHAKDRQARDTAKAGEIAKIRETDGETALAIADATGSSQAAIDYLGLDITATGGPDGVDVEGGNVETPPGALVGAGAAAQ